MVTKENGRYVVKSHDGKKNLSKPYRSKAAADRRLAQIEYFKHNPQK